MEHDLVRRWSALLRTFSGVLLSAFFAALLAASFAAPAVAQGGVTTAGCKECNAAGKTPCPKHPKADAPLEEGVEYCSVIADCPVCGGAGFVLCKHCGGTPEVRAALEKKKAQVAAHKPELAKIDEVMGRSVRKAESAHFIMVWEVDSMRVDKLDLNAHALMHLNLKRCDDLFDEYLRVFRAKPDEFGERFQIFVWFMPGDQERASLAFCEQSGKFGVKLLGARVRYSVCANKQFFTSEALFHRNLIHNVAHLVLSHQRPAEWMGTLKAGWADEGLAHWFEYKCAQRCDTYCYEEQNSNGDFKGADYKLAARKLVAADKAPPWAIVFERNSNSLKSDEHVVAFSYVDFLLQKDSAKFNELCKDLRSKIAGSEALKREFGMSPMDFEREWKAWVLATYPVSKE